MTLKHLNVLAEDDDDPMLSAVNLVDVFLVLVVALLTAVAVQTQTSANESVTIIRNAGQPDMEVVVREQGKEVRFKGAGSAAPASARSSCWACAASSTAGPPNG